MDEFERLIAEVDRLSGLLRSAEDYIREQAGVIAALKAHIHAAAPSGDGQPGILAKLQEDLHLLVRRPEIMTQALAKAGVAAVLSEEPVDGTWSHVHTEPHFIAVGDVENSYGEAVSHILATLDEYAYALPRDAMRVTAPDICLLHSSGTGICWRMTGYVSRFAATPPEPAKEEVPNA